MVEKLFGVFCDTAANGKKGLELYKSNTTKSCCKIRYKMIITETLMPVLDGFKQANRINKFTKLLRETDPTIQYIAIIA